MSKTDYFHFGELMVGPVRKSGTPVYLNEGEKSRRAGSFFVEDGYWYWKQTRSLLADEVRELSNVLDYIEEETAAAERKE